MENRLKKDVIHIMIKKEAKVFLLLSIMILMIILMTRFISSSKIMIIMIGLLFCFCIFVLWDKIAFIKDLMTENYLLYDCSFVDYHMHSIGNSLTCNVKFIINGEYRKLPIRPSEQRYFKDVQNVLLVEGYHSERIYSYKMFKKNTFYDIIEAK